jgi:2-polyprenyl-6-methoxyphenol hydroxylase-like FAD-dependent oxidoreductase
VIIIGDAAHAFSPQGGQGAAMAFEDAETLAYTMAQPNFLSQKTTLLNAWQTHRQQRVKLVKAYTDRNGKLRTPNDSYFQQVIKDWVMWAVLKYKGELNGLEWLYGYNAEDFLKELGS